MVAEGRDEVGGKRDGIAVCEEEREAFAELDDKAGAELARELDFDESGIGASQVAGWIGVRFGHPGEDARSAADG
jgi:hypothetical protein